MPNNCPIWKPLRGYGAFARVLAQGKVFSGGPVRCFVKLREESTDEVSIGFAVTRVVRAAVARNRIRRLLRESVRLHQHKIVGQGAAGVISADIVLMYVGRDPVRSSALHLADMENSVAQLLSSVSAYREAGNRRVGRSTD